MLLGEVNLPYDAAARVLRRRATADELHDAVRLHRHAGDLPRPSPARTPARSPRRSTRGRRSRPSASGRTSCATTTSSPSTSSPTPSARRCSRRSVRSRTCSVYGRGIVRRLPHDARRRPAPDPDGLQPAVLAARHARALLRRGDRHGREPRRRGAAGGAHADAVDRRARTAASRAPPRDGSSRAAVTTAFAPEHVNVEAQLRRPRLAAQVRRELAVRYRGSPEIGWGAIRAARAAARRARPPLTADVGRFVALHNFAATPTVVPLDLGPGRARKHANCPTFLRVDATTSTSGAASTCSSTPRVPLVPHRGARRPPAHLRRGRAGCRGAARTRSSGSRGRLSSPAPRAPRDALADDGGDAVLAHRDAVEGVGDLHRALLVRDDDELAALAQVLEDAEQTAEVRVVERRLDLVHDVERARPGLEDRDQQRDGGQRALAAREQREPLDLLAGRLAPTTSMPVVSRSSGFVSEMLPVPPGNSIGNTSRERRPGCPRTRRGRSSASSRRSPR